VPRLDRKWQDEGTGVRGRLSDGGAGCAYYHRCPVADKALGCDTRRPELLEAGPDHLVACLRCPGA